jgi:hypothetical protein
MGGIFKDLFAQINLIIIIFPFQSFIFVPILMEKLRNLGLYVF